MKKYKLYAILFIVLVGLSYAALGSLNRYINPWGVYGDKAAGQIEAVSGRMRRAVTVLKQRPNSICLGSSRVREGIPVSNEFWQGQSNNRMKLGLSDASIIEIYHYLKHAYAVNNSLSDVVIGLDFFSFSSSNKGRLSEISHLLLDESSNEKLIKLQLAFSFDMAKASLKKVLSRKRKSEAIAPQTPSPKKAVKEKNNARKRFEKTIRHYKNNVYSKWRKSSKKYNPQDYYKRILIFCKEHNINLRMYISPCHAWQLETIALCGLWNKFEQWKRELTEEIATVQSSAQLWDFSGFNFITCEEVPAPGTAGSMKYYQESSHFTQEAGHLILDTIFKEVPALEGFGVKLTLDNLETHLQSVRQDKEKYKSAHKADIEFIKSVFSDR